TISVTDAELPTLTCPANISTNTASGTCTRTVNYIAPTASDNCPSATVSCTPVSGSTFNKGVSTVTCTATDASGNTNTCTFTVTVNDTELPTLICPVNISTNTALGTCTRTVNYATPSASDNCPGATVSCAPASGSSFNKGVSIVT